MKLHFVSGFSLACALALLSGCASVPEKGGFDEVEKLVSERISKKVIWNQGTEDDRAVTQAIRDLLQKEISVDDAIQIALLNNHNLQATYEELGVAQADLVQAGLLRNPTLGFEMRFPGSPTSPLEIHVLQDFVDLFTMPMRKRAAGAAFESSKLRVANAVVGIAADVRSAFVRLQGSMQMLEMCHTIVEAADASLEAATRIHEAGNMTDLDLANETAMNSQARLDLAVAESEVVDLREALNRLMGLWGEDTRWTLASRLPELPSEEHDAKGLESLAMSQRLDLGAARQEVQVQAESIGISRIEGIFPDLGLGAHLEREPDGTTTTGPSLDISLPIFNQGQPAAAAAQARLRQSAQRFAALAVEIRSDVRRSWARLVSARSRAAYYQKTVIPLRHRIVEETQLEYNGMLVGVFPLLQAKQAEIDAGRNYVQALTDYWSAAVDLERAVGGPLQQKPEQQHEHSHGGAQ